MDTPAVSGWQQANEYFRDGLWREAYREYLALLKQGHPPPLGIYRKLGEVSIKLGQYIKAEEFLQRSSQRAPGHFLTQFLLGEAYRGQGRFAEAIFHYKAGLKIRPTDQESLKALAWSYFRTHYYSEALQLSRKLHRLYPQDGQGVIIEARTLLKMNRLQEGYRLIRRELRRAPQMIKPYYQSVAGDLLLSMGQLRRAYAAYKKAIRREPLLAGALLGLGRCLVARGKLKKAVVYMERAVRARPTLTEGYLALAKAYEKLQSPKALYFYRYFRRKVAADPEYLSMVPRLDAKIRGLASARQGQG